MYQIIVSTKHLPPEKNSISRFWWSSNQIKAQFLTETEVSWDLLIHMYVINSMVNSLIRCRDSRVDTRTMCNPSSPSSHFCSLSLSWPGKLLLSLSLLCQSVAQRRAEATQKRQSALSVRIIRAERRWKLTMACSSLPALGALICYWTRDCGDISIKDTSNIEQWSRVSSVHYFFMMSLVSACL